MSPASASKLFCPMTATAELLSDTWTMLIMRALTESPKRFTELAAWLESISTRTLTNKLNILLERGLVRKSADGVYHATKKGLGLKSVERAMIKYAEKYL
jgi:DNA-binding HxlR family transcriptional regulator